MDPTSGGSCIRARPMWPAFLTSAMLLASCGGGGGYTPPSNMGPPLAPTVMLTIDKTTITVGQSVQLSWTTTNATSCVASGGWTGSEAVNSSQAVTPTAAGNVSFTLTCTAPAGNAYSGGGGGQTAQTVNLTVNAASAFSVTKLVSDTSAGGGLHTDSNLVNGWGIVFGPSTPVWVANNGTETSTLYDGAGHPLPATPLVVALPGLAPTGIVFSSSTTDFMITVGGTTAAAKFIFSGESGQIAAWAGTTAVVVYPAAGGDSGGAIYKGLTVAQNNGATFLYAPDFHNNKVDVFDNTFAKQTLPNGAFVDPNLPAGYAPFGIQAIANGASGSSQIYVSYAKQDAQAEDDSPGAGLGLIDIYGADGTFIKRLVTTGVALNAPWGMALAPSDFGTLSNMLLVGNFGDGKINGYDPSSGTFIGAVTDSTGAPIVEDGLWGIAFGNGVQQQPTNTLFFAAGPNGEQHGLYGRIDLGATPPTLN
jgi:uncharacterized protein (TIGR03118 family)